MPIESWFPTLILYEDLSKTFDSDFNNKVFNKAKELQQTYKPTQQWVCDTFNTVGMNIREDDLFKDFYQTIGQYVLRLSNEYKIDNKYNLMLQDLWLNVAPPGEYQEYHTHGSNHFSAVYYVRTPENSGNIIFRPIQNWFEGNQLDLSEETNVSTRLCEYKPRESLLLVFKSDLIHMVEKNRSKEDRVSVSMNFKFMENK